MDSDNKYIYVCGYIGGDLSDGSASDYWNPWVGKFYAKSGEQIWLKQLSYGEEYEKNSLSRDLVVDDDSVYVLIQIGTDDLTEADAMGKTLVIKFNLDTGEQEWTYNFESENDVPQKPHSLVTDGNGYLYMTGIVAGSMLSPDGDALETTGTLDAWIAKLSTDQELNWIVQFGSSESESYGRDLAVDGSGNVYAVGYTTVTTSIEGVTEEKEDIWIAKYSSDGERQWGESLSSASDQNERAIGVAVDDSGGVYATGFTYGDLKEGDPNVSYTKYQAWIAKLQASTGEQVWLDQFGDDQGTFAVWMRGISVDNNGGVYIGGWTDGQFGDLEAVTSRDALSFKYNAYTGAQVWLKQINSSDDSKDAIYNMNVASDGSLYLTGFTAGEMSDIETPQGSNDIWIAQLREVPESYDELAQVLKRYIDHKVSQSTETVSEASETTTTTISSSSTATSSFLEVAADVVASNSSTEEETESTTVSENSLSVLSVAASLASSES
ncbi:MAG: hypothetical protein F6K47_07720 [Symploca sp. SIO2E6]|nr:hypothetical protein [Symploca sp. SIO2E6]